MKYKLRLKSVHSKKYKSQQKHRSSHTVDANVKKGSWEMSPFDALRVNYVNLPES